MPLLSINDVGRGGIVRDTSPLLLPPNVWSNGRNVRFDNGGAQKISGHTRLFTAAYNPDFVIYWPRPVTPYYIYANATNVSRVDGAGNVANILGSLSPSSSGKWHGSLFNGGFSVVMNNTVDAPHYITYGTAGQPFETELTELPNWPDDLSAGVIRPLGNALIAGNLTDSSGSTVNFQPSTIRISSRAAPGGVPSSWTVGSSLLTTADEFELSSEGTVREIVGLRGYALVFTDNSIHRLSVAQGPGQPTQVQNLNYGNGCLSINCAVEIEGRVLVVDRNDIYLTDGSGSIDSVSDGFVRDYFFENLNDTHAENTFVQRNKAQDEVWIFYPTNRSTSGVCDEVLIYNYRHKTWTIRDAPGSLSATEGPSRSNNNFVESDEHIVFTGDSSMIHLGDSGTDFNGTDFTAFLEKTKLNLSEEDSTKWTGTFYPIIEGSGNITLRFATTDPPGAAVNLLTDRMVKSMTFRIEDDTLVNPRVNGKFLSFRISGDDEWDLSGYALETKTTDRRN